MKFRLCWLPWPRRTLSSMCVLLGLGLTLPIAACSADSPESNDPSIADFEAPVRLTAGDEAIAVDPPGYACPTMADVDGDGKMDLVVGQFNQGHMKFFKNIAESGQPPKFAAGQWLMTGEEKAVVPGVW